MDDSQRVRRGHPGRHLPHQFGRGAHSERAGPEPVGEGAAGQVLHRYVRDAVPLAEPVHADDVQVVDGRDRLRLGEEPG